MQIIKYRWEDWKPVLIAREENKQKKIDLMDKDICLKIGKRYCIGFHKDGKHNPCPSSAAVSGEWFCKDCMKNDDFFPCVKCVGSFCFNENQREKCIDNEYYLYLAAFDSFLKIGVSYKFRLLERLVEQGADFAAKIALIQDGKYVRKLEQKIKHILNITDRVRGYQKHKLLFADPNNSVLSITNAIEKLNQNNIKIVDPAIYDLRHYYKLHKVMSQPKSMEIKDDMEIEGKVVAAKGNILILEKGDFFAINAHRLIGREVRY